MAAIIIITIYLVGYFLSIFLVVRYSRESSNDMDNIITILWPIVLIILIIFTVISLFKLIGEQAKGLSDKLKG